MKKLIEEVATKFGINEEDVHTLFEYFVETYYDGRVSSFLDDMERGIVMTAAGRMLISDCVDAAMELISAREPY